MLPAENGRTDGLRGDHTLPSRDWRGGAAAAPFSPMACAVLRLAQGGPHAVRCRPSPANCLGSTDWFALSPHELIGSCASLSPPFVKYCKCYVLSRSVSHGDSRVVLERQLVPVGGSSRDLGTHRFPIC